VAVREEVTGLNRAYWINGVELEMDSHLLLWCTWHLARADTTQYWDLGETGYSELGDTTVLGPL